MDPADIEARKRSLDWIAWVALIDFLLLIPLIWASSFVADRHSIVSILGPIHGIGFLALVVLVIQGRLSMWWGWWFPLIVVITGGPPGALIGDYIVRRRLRDQTSTTPPTSSPG